MLLLKTIATKYRLRPGEPATAQLATVIRTAIVRMEIEPGDMLSEQEIADAFGLSRHPVRDALIQLRDTGLIRSLPQRGTQVLRISATAVANSCFVREALEGAAARRAAIVRTDEILRQMSYCISLQKIAAESNEIDIFLAQDDEFHRLICVAAGQGLAWSIVDAHKAQIDRIRHLKLEKNKTKDPLNNTLYTVNIAEHENIVDAIRQKDADRAEKIVRHHATKILEVVAPLSKRYPHLFENDAFAAAI